jgi:hypothetical protein
LGFEVSRFDTISVENETTSPSSTACGQRISKNPGDTPSSGVISPRAAIAARRAARVSTSLRIAALATCSPEAASGEPTSARIRNAPDLRVLEVHRLVWPLPPLELQNALLGHCDGAVLIDDLEKEL